MRATFKLMLRVALAVVLVATLAQIVQAQRGRSPGRADQNRPRGPADAGPSELEREYMQRVLEEEVGKTPPRRDLQIALAQFREDFMRIQIVNNEILKALGRGGALDLKFVARSAAEIKKRGERLKLNLALPELEESAKRLQLEEIQETQQLKKSLLALDALIAGFVTNPVFQQTNVSVVDAQLSLKAQRDLDEIISISGHIKRVSEKMHKTAQK